MPESFGSGIVIDESGLILTSDHVVRDATKIFVRLPGRPGQLRRHPRRRSAAATWPCSACSKPPPGLKAVKLGDGGSVQQGPVGASSLANPFAAGFRDGSPSGQLGHRQQPPPAGARQRQARPERAKTLHHYGTLIQTDARLNLGCSGGALLDLHGELVGLTTSMAAISGSETAGGFAIPFDAGIRRIIEVLRKRRGGRVRLPRRQLVRAIRATSAACPIDGVTSGSPAARAGLQGGDVILAINGQPIRENDDLFLAIGTRWRATRCSSEYQRAGSGPGRDCAGGAGQVLRARQDHRRQRGPPRCAACASITPASWSSTLPQAAACRACPPA